MKNILFAALVLLIFSGCEKESAGAYSGKSLIFGWYFGECVGEGCVETYLLTGNNLYEDTKDSYMGNGGFNFVKTGYPQYLKAKDLYDYIPEKLLKLDVPVIGVPDGGDWGGIYIQYSDGGVTKTWLIDMMESNIPEWLHPFVLKVRETIHDINS